MQPVAFSDKMKSTLLWHHNVVMLLLLCNECSVYVALVLTDLYTQGLAAALAKLVQFLVFLCTNYTYW